MDNNVAIHRFRFEALKKSEEIIAHNKMVNANAICNSVTA
jgi:hypothetical protein